MFNSVIGCCSILSFSELLFWCSLLYDSVLVTKFSNMYVVFIVFIQFWKCNLNYYIFQIIIIIFSFICIFDFTMVSLKLLIKGCLHRCFYQLIRIPIALKTVSNISLWVSTLPAVTGLSSVWFRWVLSLWAISIVGNGLIGVITHIKTNNSIPMSLKYLIIFVRNQTFFILYQDNDMSQKFFILQVYRV